MGKGGRTRDGGRKEASLNAACAGWVARGWRGSDRTWAASIREWFGSWRGKIRVRRQAAAAAVDGGTDGRAAGPPDKGGRVSGGEAWEGETRSPTAFAPTRRCGSCCCGRHRCYGLRRCRHLCLCRYCRRRRRRLAVASTACGRTAQGALRNLSLTATTTRIDSMARGRGLIRGVAPVACATAVAALFTAGIVSLAAMALPVATAVAVETTTATAAAPAAASVSATAVASGDSAHSPSAPQSAPILPSAAERQARGGVREILRFCTPGSPVRTRKEVRDLTAAETAALISAWRRAINDGSAEAAVRVHNAATAAAHWGAQFLPWHRGFLLLMEDALRRYDPTVTLPYCTL